jgi:hypothetical protein
LKVFRDEEKIPEVVWYKELFFKYLGQVGAVASFCLPTGSHKKFKIAGMEVRRVSVWTKSTWFVSRLWSLYIDRMLYMLVSLVPCCFFTFMKVKLKENNLHKTQRM